MSDADKLGQDDIEAMLAAAQQGAGAAPPPKAAAPAAPAAATPAASEDDEVGAVSQADIELLLNKAEAAIASIDEPEASLPAGMQPFSLTDLGGATPTEEAATLELVRDVQLDLRIELGRTHMHLEDVLRLRQGAVVPLDKLAGDPVDVFVNGRLIARGEVLVLNDNFCVRVTELVAGESAA